MSEWISVEERLPELYEAVLCTNTALGQGTKHQRPYWQARRTEDGPDSWRWQAFVHNVITLGVSHWMPLPEPPEKEDE